jgi:GH15 family glucan-1,4-alpha-glucosidase
MPIAYPPLGRVGLIGDRRTAAVVAADGTIGWVCMPHYNDRPLFASMLDAEKGGHWHIGPRWMDYGHQYYLDGSAVLVTQWQEGDNLLEVADFMPDAETFRTEGQDNRNTIVRRMVVKEGTIECGLSLRPAHNFQKLVPTQQSEHEVSWQVEGQELRLISSFPVQLHNQAVTAAPRLHEGDVAWLVLRLNAQDDEWNLDRVDETLEKTKHYWHDWSNRLTYTGPHRDKVFRSAKLVHLLSHAPTGSLVAAPTTSLPERIGGSSNYDYRYAWLRDASLSLASLSMLGDLESATRYMDWLTTLSSGIDAPLQPLYQISGSPEVPQQEVTNVNGYRSSLPVLYGNHAAQQYQPDSYGYFAECALIYLEQGGEWKPEYWRLVERLADFIADEWQRPSHGIWELPEVHHYVSSKVMSWITLDRAVKIAQHLSVQRDIAFWQRQMDAIHEDVMTKGWSERQQSFRQHYDTDALDASVLLMSVMGFLPGDHEKILSTIRVLDEQLTINGLVHRFDPQATLGAEQPLGEFEGAFLPTCFFMATAYAKAGLKEQAEYILRRVESVVGELGLISEEMDARTFELLGNTPLVFSLVEYIRAAMELDKAKPLAKVGLMAGMLKRKLTR